MSGSLFWVWVSVAALVVVGWPAAKWVRRKWRWWRRPDWSVMRKRGD